MTLNITQNGGIYTLDGFDDQCGASQRAPLVGMAVPNPDGTIGFGLHIVTVPGGRAVQVDARIVLSSLGGPWTDSSGNGGTFVLNGNAAGSARPAPTVSGTLLAPGSVPALAIANGAVTQSKLAAGAVSAQQLAPSAQPAGALSVRRCQRPWGSGVVELVHNHDVEVARLSNGAMPLLRMHAITRSMRSTEWSSVGAGFRPAVRRGRL